MALRAILKDNDETLRKVCRPVTDFGKRTAELMDDLVETLIDAHGAGLAAPQVGIRRRAAVILREGEYVELINPEIIRRSEEHEGLYEGCLSFPGLRGYLLRPTDVTVHAFDREGREFDLECTGMAARAACHEIDHLNGVLFVDLVDELITEEELDRILDDLDQEGEEQEPE